MKINTPIFINPLNKITPKQTIPCFGIRPLQKDTFESSSLKTVKYEGKTVKGKQVKNVTLKDRKGNDKPGYIIQNGDNYYACNEDKALCRMKLENHKKYMYIAELYGENNCGKLKGAGTELIKYAVEQSREQGFDGELNLYMAGSGPFYYKNNFRLSEENRGDYIKDNAALDYATRNNLSYMGVLNRASFIPLVVLDKKGADALMQGRRLYEESKSQKLYETKIKIPWQTCNVVADYCDFGDKFAIQLVTKKLSDGGQIACLTGKNENGKLIPEPIDDIFDIYLDEPAVQDALYEALDYTQNNLYPGGKINKL